MSLSQENTTAASGEITKEQITRTAEGLYAYTDEAALNLCLQDADRCDAYMNQQQWSLEWNDADVIFQSPRSGAGGTPTVQTRSRVPRFTLSNHIASIVPKMTGGLFYENPYFILKPRPGTSQDIIDAKQAVMATQLDDMGFKIEVERGLEQMALLGTQIYMWGWLECDKKVRKFVRKAEPETIKGAFTTTKAHTSESDAFEPKWETVTVQRPFIKALDIRHVLVDPGCRVGDIRKAKYVIHRDYLTYDDLDSLRDVEGYDIPDTEELKKFFFPPEKTEAAPGNQTEVLPANLRAWIQHALPRQMDSSSDPMAHTLLSLQRWDNQKVIHVIQQGCRSILIRNEANPFGKIPFYSSNWRNIPDSFHGMGLGKLIGTDQRVEEGVLNAALEILGYSVKPSYIRKKGLNAPTQQIRQSLGGIIDVDDDVDKAFRIMELPKIPAEAWQIIGQSQSASAATSGANEQVMQGISSPGIKTTGMRSGTGAAAVVQANASRLDGPVERFLNQVFVPWLAQMDELNNERLPASVLRTILGEEISADFGKDMDHIEYRNSVFEFDALAGAHLGAKKEFLQAIPFYMQMLNSPPLIQELVEADYEIDAVALVKMFADYTGTRTTGIFKKMSPERKQQKQANSPAALQQQKVQAASALQDKKFGQEQQAESQKQLGRAASEVQRQIFEKALTPQEMEGTPANEGIGDQD